MSAKSKNYIEFLFDESGNLKNRYAPVINYQSKTNSFILKYSIPGHHSPRQYFSFSTIPVSFPNQYVAEIFRIFSISYSFLFRHPHNVIPKAKKSVINNYFGIKTVTIVDAEELEIAQYNLNLAISLGKSNHSLFYFDSYLEAYKVLHPEIKYTKNVVNNIQAHFNKIISSC